MADEDCGRSAVIPLCHMWEQVQDSYRGAPSVTPGVPVHPSSAALQHDSSGSHLQVTLCGSETGGGTLQWLHTAEAAVPAPD